VIQDSVVFDATVWIVGDLHTAHRIGERLVPDGVAMRRGHRSGSPWAMLGDGMRMVTVSVGILVMRMLVCFFFHGSSVNI
jgi:hypothetical protein